MLCKDWPACRSDASALASRYSADSSSSVIVAEVTYDFFPKIGHFIMGTIALSEKFYLRPRKSDQVTRTDNNSPCTAS